MIEINLRNSMTYMYVMDRVRLTAATPNKYNPHTDHIVYWQYTDTCFTIPSSFENSTIPKRIPNLTSSKKLLLKVKFSDVIIGLSFIDLITDDWVTDWVYLWWGTPSRQLIIVRMPWLDLSLCETI